MGAADAPGGGAVSAGGGAVEIALVPRRSGATTTTIRVAPLPTQRASEIDQLLPHQWVSA
ncbi:hypothetical protein DYL61_23930 [Pseudomonas nabeulensis]|uniref:Uncharacterized protein n=1 Tax=Pseudomonas nabeulensis TaxID=2293833 RepID=A0A4Z0AR08_9PSED|nr:hypothetical protein DYL61_23930 [Pseudomonas nabeulensis]